MLPYNKNLVSNARSLRKNMTSEERRLWYDLFKRFPFTVKRQHNIENYIVDFYIARTKTVIEIDGLQHTAPEKRTADKERDLALSKWGITVLRYSNKEVNENFNSVAEDILLNTGLSFDDLKNPSSVR